MTQEQGRHHRYRCHGPGPRPQLRGRNPGAGGSSPSPTSIRKPRRNSRTALGPEHVFADGGEMIGPGLIDAVIIAAPDRFHAPLTLRALDKGLPVLCEKPLAPTAEEAAAVTKERELGEALVTVGFMRRFDPGYLALRERLVSGIDGPLLMSHSVHRNVEAHPDGTTWRTPSPTPASTRLTSSRGSPAAPSPAWSGRAGGPPPSSRSVRTPSCC